METEIIGACKDYPVRIATDWTLTASEDSEIYRLNFSTGFSEAAIGFLPRTLTLAKRDSYIQKRIRYRVKKTLRYLLRAKI